MKKIFLLLSLGLTSILNASIWNNSTKQCAHKCINRLAMNTYNFDRNHIERCMNQCEIKYNRYRENTSSYNRYSDNYYSDNYNYDSYNERDSINAKDVILNTITNAINKSNKKISKKRHSKSSDQSKLYVTVKSGYVISKHRKKYLNQKTYLAEKGVKKKYYLTSNDGYNKSIYLYLTNNNELKVWVGSNETNSYTFRDNTKWYRGQKGFIEKLRYSGKYRIFDLEFELKY
mgnify:CR=1 FL=1|jgi:hypothetical protein